MQFFWTFCESWKIKYITVSTKIFMFSTALMNLFLCVFAYWPLHAIVKCSLFFIGYSLCGGEYSGFGSKFNCAARVGSGQVRSGQTISGSGFNYKPSSPLKVISTYEWKMFLKTLKYDLFYGQEILSDTLWCEIRTGGCVTAEACSDPAGPSDEPRTTSYWARCCRNIKCLR